VDHSLVYLQPVEEDDNTYINAVLVKVSRFSRTILRIRGTSQGPVSVCVCVRPSVTSHVLLKRLNVGSHKQRHTIAQGI